LSIPYTVNPSSQYGYKINELLIDIANDNNLEQLISELTHENHILDLEFSNTQIVSGISDHEAIYFQINHLPSQPEPIDTLCIFTTKPTSMNA